MVANLSEISSTGDASWPSENARFIRGFLGRKSARLSSGEYRVLYALARHAGKIVPHMELLRRVWGKGHVPETHYVTVYAARLRRKLAGRGRSPRIKAESVWGRGYRLAVEPFAAFAHQPSTGSGKAG